MANPQGPFAAMFDDAGGGVPGYLPLLNLYPGADTDKAVATLRNAVLMAGGDLARYASALLQEQDWRPHVVAAAALVVARASGLCVDRLWQLVDAGSWATPQLAAALSRVDPEFLVRARERIARHGDAARTTAATAPIRPGPAAQQTATLIALCGALPEAATWLPSMAATPEARALIEADRDGSGAIALNWLQRLDDLSRKS